MGQPSFKTCFKNGRKQIEVKVMGTADDWEPMEKVLKEKYLYFLKH